VLVLGGKPGPELVVTLPVPDEVPDVGTDTVNDIVVVRPAGGLSIVYDPGDGGSILSAEHCPPTTLHIEHENVVAELEICVEFAGATK
jgi:hypothetical protein